MSPTMRGEQPLNNKITTWYDLGSKHWRWRCAPCNEEHGTTATESNYDGPAMTAIYGHIDLVHPGTEMEIETKDADGDVSDGDVSDGD